VNDQQALNDELRDILANHSKLVQSISIFIHPTNTVSWFLILLHLGIQQQSMMAMMVSLQRKIEQQSSGVQEQEFFSQSLVYLTSTSRCQVQPEDWMITPFEVEFLEEIGSGGLFVPVFLKTILFLVDAAPVLVEKSGGAIGEKLKSLSKA
jgi:hypothetical protein